MSVGEPRRVCLLTGASGLLGTSFCNLFGDRYDIAGVYRTKPPSLDVRFFDPLGEETESPIFSIQADLTEPGTCERVVEATLSHFGKIDLVVNSAVSSTWEPMFGSDRLISSGYTQMSTNVLLPLEVSLIVARRFWEGREEENRLENRNVVNISSIAGLKVYRGSGQSLYAASKAALNHLTSHMADEFAAIGVRVNATAANSFPSIVSTERAAEAIKYLDDSTATGTIVVVDRERTYSTRSDRTSSEDFLEHTNTRREPSL